MVRIRMKRMGRTHRPFYRINAVDRRAKRDGRVIENLGWYNPIEKDESKQLSLNEERIKHWLGVGAQPSETVADLLAKNGLIDAEAHKAAREKRIARKVAKLEEERKAKDAAAKAEAEAKAKEEAEAKAKAEADAKAKAKAEAEAAAGAEEEKSGE